MVFYLLDRFRSTEDFFELNLKYLFLVGLWPDEKLTKNQLFIYKIYQNTLNIFAVTFLVLSGIKTYQIREDFILCLSNIDKIIALYNYFFKVIFFVILRGELKKLIDDILFSRDRVKEGSRNLMINHLMLVTFISSSMMLIFTLVGIYNDEMSVETWMPFDPYKDKMNLILASQVVFVLVGVPFSYRALGMQGIVCSILIYLCDQLKDLQQTLKEFKFDILNAEESREKFKNIVKKHIRLMRYSKSMEKMFKEYFLIQNLAVTLELCLNAMMVTMLKTEQKSSLLGFLLFLGLALLNAYIYSKLGNDLITESEAVSLAAYSSAWLSWPADLRRDVLLIIRASQTPFQMSAGGVAVISMHTYALTLYNGYSIFAVLNDVMEN